MKLIIRKHSIVNTRILLQYYFQFSLISWLGTMNHGGITWPFCLNCLSILFTRMELISHKVGKYLIIGHCTLNRNLYTFITKLFHQKYKCFNESTLIGWKKNHLLLTKWTKFPNYGTISDNWINYPTTFTQILYFLIKCYLHHSGEYNANKITVMTTFNI